MSLGIELVNGECRSAFPAAPGGVADPRQGCAFVLCSDRIGSKREASRWDGGAVRAVRAMLGERGGNGFLL
jgi:hypothetical protein